MALLSLSLVVTIFGTRNPVAVGSLLAVLAAVAFGITTPIIQRLGEGAGALPIVTLLYAGSAGASFCFGARGSKNAREAPVRAAHLRRIIVVALLGAVCAPVALVWALQHTGAATASLLLNFEAVFTVLLGRLFYREHVGRRVAIAVAVMSAAGVCLALDGGSRSGRFDWGALGVLFATLAWALDNTVARPLAELNPAQVVRWKGALGASLSFIASLWFDQPFPKGTGALGLLVCGATGYGLSLRLYLLAQRRIGAGRTGSVFALAPFVGAAAAWTMGDRTAREATLVAAALFGVGIYLHLTELHQHPHSHEEIEHEHAHRHDDDHHDHLHEPRFDGEHSHPHRHDDWTHEHPHGPDAHHVHRHT